MKTLILAALALALSGCGDGSYSSNSDGEDVATMLLLGATAVMTGYNQGRQPMPMVSTSCTTTNGITNCLSF
jgi:hypothetical protein